MRVTIHYGSGNTLDKEFPEGTTFGQIKADAALRSVLGYGQNVELRVGNVAQPDHGQLAPGDQIQVYDKGCTKAVAA